MHGAGWGRRGVSARAAKGSENSPGGLGLPAHLLDTCCGRSGGGSEVEEIGWMAQRDGRRLDLPWDCATLPHPAALEFPSAEGREWLSMNWGLRGALAPPPFPPHYPLCSARCATRKRWWALQLGFLVLLFL